MRSPAGHAQRALEPLELARHQSRLSFFLLCGFIATQGFLVPVMSLPVNWALWPNLPDLFGIFMVISVAISRR